MSVRRLPLLLLLLLPLAGCNYDPLPLLQNQGEADVQDLDQAELPPALDAGQFQGTLLGSAIGSGD